MTTKIKSKLSSLIKNPIKSDQPIGTFIGLLIILVVVYFLYIGISSKNKISNSWNLTTTVENVANLPAGALVMINGVQIGNVTSVKLNSTNFYVEIKMNISGNVKIPNDSTLEIVTNNLMSDKFIKIIPGISKEYFKNNDKISGKSAETIEEIIGKMVFSL